MKNRIALFFVMLITLTVLGGALAYDAYAPDAEEPAVVVIHWQDITATASWNEDEEPYLKEFYTVGWLYEETEDTVTIASSWDTEDGVWREFNSFPRGCVLSITEVR